MPKHLIPETFRLGKNWWRVEFLPPSEMAQFNANGRGRVLGLCDGEDRIIYLADDLKGRRLVQTFLHEAIHAVDYDFNIKIPHKLVYALDRHLGNFLWTNYLSPRRRRR
jgi:F420-dependent methylenetetrahydromethanopterin dehydrogenase